LTPDVKDEHPAEEGAQVTDVITSEDVEPAPTESEVAAAELEETQPIVAAKLPKEAELAAVAVEVQATPDPAPNSLADQLLKAEPAVLDIAQQVAYDEYLKDTSGPMNGFEAEDGGEAETPGSPEPVATIDASGDLQIEMDTKNAHVWNELGNVYFNTSAFDDAIVAYSKAIELDRWFAWPYSNLALAYVQKRRFVEAILLYQRSIELFSGDKDKAISWNRLGNVYRRLNDYENAIAAYQRADALDPDNSTLSLQSRFSLLGNYAMEQKPSYVS
jgi:tetratricopeptide (TPR) repeat protein